MTATTASATARLRPLFIAIVLLGSFLLFLIQPLVARLVLPLLGGSPSVWNTAMIFYQSALLVGYAYAHALQRLAFRTQAIVHLGVLAAAACTLPIGIAANLSVATGNAAALWLIGLLAVSIGPVFVAVAAQAPLMQAWFSRSTDPAAASPFFLYAASNIGSLLGLVTYPFLLEPFTALPFQTALWSAGFVLLALLVGWGALAIRQGGDRPPATLPDSITGRCTRPVTWRRRLHWLLLAAVPSGLMLSTTTHITTDIMAMPLLWVLPLGAYLLSFILVFSTRGPRHSRIATAIAPVALLLAGSAGLMVVGHAATLYGIASLLLLLIVATSLHGALAADRPPAARLTEYYLIMAAGGVVGGIFPALIAPLIFDWVYEHPILLLLAALLVPARPLGARIGALWRGRGIASRLLRILTPPATLLLGWALGHGFDYAGMAGWQIAALAALFGIAILSIGRPFSFAWHMLMLMLAVGGWQQIDISTQEGARQRSFFGIYTIQNSQRSNTRRLLHGTTLHGAQSLDPARATQPMTYYAPHSAVGLAMQALPVLHPDGARVGVIGLGTGSLLCYAKPGQQWTIFEIDPLIVKLATNPAAFSYHARCKPDARIVLGDARLMLAKEPKGRFDLLAVDAFSSDAIPLHLLTAEAFTTYLNALAPDGLLLVHVSNRFLRLQPVVAAIARRQGLSARIVDYVPGAEDSAERGYTASQWIVLARDDRVLEQALRATTRPQDFQALEEDAAVAAWTDSFASILPVLKPVWRRFI